VVALSLAPCERACVAVAPAPPNPSATRSQPNAVREAIDRLQAYSAAGADVLFAPGVQQPEEIEMLVNAVWPKPLNLLVVRDIGLSVSQIAALGVRRISLGGALALAAWGGFLRAARALKSDGTFGGLRGAASYTELDELFATETRER